MSELSVRRDLAGGEWGDSLVLDYCCVDKSDEQESETREWQQDHDRRGENEERRCAVRQLASTMAYMGCGDGLRPAQGWYVFRHSEKLNHDGPTITGSGRISKCEIEFFKFHWLFVFFFCRFPSLRKLKSAL